ncbi:MAG TPA: trypsin-like peptidase domain-containing protein [Dehalococcoidia bacterium]|nr:trypsin-like peptidase domain-containing protein [Dehalococcoidia bacterium]
MKNIVSDVKKTLAFLGEMKRWKTNLFATGFFVRIEGIFHLVTAKHVVINRRTGRINDKEMKVFCSSKERGLYVTPVRDLKKKFGINWVFHKNKEVDIAIIPFALDPQKADFKVIPDEIFLPIDKLFELYDVFFLSYQPGIESHEKICPIFRSGTISIINEDGTYYIDAPAFPGNSGSPVFVKPSPITFTEKGYAIGKDEIGGKFIGIIGEYIPYTEVARSDQTGLPRVIFEENSGLSKVWSVSFINEVIKSDTFNIQLEIVKKIAEKEEYNAQR